MRVMQLYGCSLHIRGGVSEIKFKMQIKQNQLKIGNYFLEKFSSYLLYYCSVYTYNVCDVTTLFSMLISMPVGGGNAIFGDGSHYPLPALLQ